MNGVGAWLLDFGNGQRGALGVREVVHLAHTPHTTAVPQTPPHCSRVLVFGERLLPAWDVAVWLAAAPPGRACNLAAIVAYQPDGRGPAQLGALLLAQPPVRVTVSDEDACDLPRAQPCWRAIAMSCFRRGDEAIPVLNLRRMFSAALSAGPLVGGGFGTLPQTAACAM